jgi:hypothetical protein
MRRGMDREHEGGHPDGNRERIATFRRTGQKCVVHIQRSWLHPSPR